VRVGVAVAAIHTGPLIEPVATSGPLAPTCVEPYASSPDSTTLNSPRSKPALTSHLIPSRWKLGSGWTSTQGEGAAGDRLLTCHSMDRRPDYLLLSPPHPRSVPASCYAAISERCTHFNSYFVLPLTVKLKPG
jgi:hypothetical protein